MYLPKQFEETRPQILEALIREQALATIITLSDGLPDANHIPLRLRHDEGGKWVLEGHVARANPLWTQAGQHVLVIFQGPQTYISPSWYATKKEHGKVVPTWNYAVVQARGVLRVNEDPEWLHGMLNRLTGEHEAAVSSDWKVDDAPADFLDQLKKAIVGIEIPVDSVMGKWKVSQNRPPADRAGVRKALMNLDPASAALVQEGER